MDPNYTVPENGDVSNVAIEANKVDEGTTDTVEGQDGVLVFDNLKMYQRYLIVETDAPAYVTTRTAPFCVDLPMTNPTGDGWMADVYVYPKNFTTRGTVTLNKVGEDKEALLARSSACIRLRRVAMITRWLCRIATLCS